MNKLVIIPVYKFHLLVNDIRKFYEENLDEADIIVIDDSAGCLGLKASIILGHTQSEIKNNKEYDLIIINEHDVIPNESALYACLEVFTKTIENKDVASVSTIYKHNNKDCYPSHVDWYNGITVMDDHLFGEVKYVGLQGIPFGFSLWKPKALKLIENIKLPDTWKLDSEFGKLLGDKGYHHLRLIDYQVEHYNKGVRSWKKVN